MSDKKPGVAVSIIKAQEIQKADASTALTNDQSSGTEWISHPMQLEGLEIMVDHSNILPQCIRAYKDNIAGFGIALRYKEDIDEIDAMKAEWEAADKVVKLLSIEKATKEVFEAVIEARETFGIAYLEVIRNLAGDVVEVTPIRESYTITKTVPLEPATESTYYFNGEAVIRKKKFRKYKQYKNGKTVYFKEFGDPRVMDAKTGEYTDSPQLEANEILEFAIGSTDYGKVRWIGQIMGVDGSRKAEFLNNNYFENGRHIPLAVIVSGGTLTEESHTKLKEYMAGIKGEAGQHAFLVLEVEDTGNKADFEVDKKPAVELKDLAGILQKDELFQEYLENNRKRVQSAFRLPDLYTGYTTDFNRATAQTAMEVTEKQVFQPERENLAWVINNKLLNGYRFKYVEVYFKEPDITNPDDLAKMLAITERSGGLTPNMAKRITYETMGWDTAEDYAEDWGNTPIAVSRTQPGMSLPNLAGQLDAAIQKAAAAKDEDVVVVMKEVKRLLESRERQKRGDA